VVGVTPSFINVLTSGATFGLIIEATGLGQANVSKHLKILNQAGIISREQQGINVFYKICNPFLFELCDLVCDSIAWQVDKQNQQLAELQKF
jgi:DNA-binding transcriptional ArsR family regulator